jgi:uncharacterized membrane protein YcaP (DUF421 family)
VDVRWHEMFALSVSPLELVLRGSIIYAFLFLIFRLVLRRDVGSVGIADILVLVIIADASQNAMAGEYRSVSDGMILISTIVGWNFAIDWLAYHFPRLRRLLEPPPLCLVKDGRMLGRNMRQELLTEEELRSKLREEGVSELAEVARAYMERDGKISVVKREGS